MKHKYPVVGVKKAPRKSLAPFWGGVLAVMVLALVGAGPGSFNQAIVQAFGGPLNLTAATTGQVPVKQANGSWAPGAGGTIGGALGSTDNVLLRSDGTGGVTAQGSDATLTDGEVLNLTATGALALGTGTDDPRWVRGGTDIFSAQDGSGNGAKIALGSGTQALPAITFGDADSGIWASGTTFAVAVNNSNRLSLDGTAFYSAGVIDAPAGSASAVAYRINSGANTGLFGTADTNISAAIGGTRVFDILAGGLVRIGDAGVVLKTLSNSLAVRTTNDADWAPLGLTGGSAAAVGLQIAGDANTGIYGTADSSIGMAIGGTQIAAVGTRGVTRRIYTEAITGNYTLANAQSDQVFTNTGAGGAVEIELSSITATGFTATFVATDNQDITIDPGTSDKFVGLAGGWADGEAMLVDDQNDAVKITRLSTGDWLVEWTRGTLTEETP